MRNPGKTIILSVLILLSSALKGQTILDNASFRKLSDHEKVDTLSSLCWQLREKETDLAISYAEYAMDLARENDLKMELGRLYNYLGVIYQHYKHQVRKAIPLYNEGLLLSLKVKDSIEIAYVYNNLGDAFYNIGNVPLAQEYAEKSMEMFRHLNNNRGIAYSFINLGSVNRMKQEYREALDYFMDAIDIRKTFGDSVGIASASLEIAETFSLMGKTDTAMAWYRISLEKHRELENKNYIAYSLNGMGHLYLEQGLYDSAYRYFQRALDYSSQRTNMRGIISNREGLALVYLHTGKEKEGEKLLEKALQTAKRSQNSQNILSVYKTRAEFYLQMENFRKASLNYQNFIFIYDSLYNEMQFRTMEEIKTRFGMTEQINRINEDLETRQREEVYLFIFIVLLLLVTVTLVMRYRTRVRLSRKLEESNQAKDKIFSVISHDLLNPFNVLIGFSSILQKNLKEKKYSQAITYSQHIHKTATDTYNLLTNLLNWARAQREKITASPVPYNITDQLQEVKEMNAKQAELKDISITISVEEQIMVHADKDMTKTVLINLTSNAVKFSEKGGKVFLSAVVSNNMARILVEDQGTGIPSTDLEDIFSNLSNKSTDGTDGEKGTGLGLMVCKEFVELNNGKINVASKEGEGSVFSFTLPLHSGN